MNVWNRNTLSEALNAEIKDLSFQGGMLQFNSQDVNEGDVFIALKGPNGDGHDYALDAYNKGASIIIAHKPISDIPDDKIALVPDTDKALTDMSQYKREHSSATFIAITGSAGKTSTKEALRYILSKFKKSFANRGSYNNWLGVRLELASMPDDTEYAIIEVGMNHSGEIREIIPLIRPHIAMINNILPGHIGNLGGSLQNIADAKLEIFESMQEDAIAILNMSSNYYEYCLGKLKELGIERIYNFGYNENEANASLKIYNPEKHHVINLFDKEIPFKAEVTGRHRILNFTPILLICEILKIDASKAAEYFIDIEELKGRGKIYNITYNGHNCTLIDDSYNAIYSAIVASLKHLSEMQHDYKVAVLGDMVDLGEDEVKYYLDLLPYILDSKIQKLHCVGPVIKNLYDKLPSEIKGNHYIDYKALANDLKEVIDRDMMILFKSAKATKLLKVVASLVD